MTECSTGDSGVPCLDLSCLLEGGSTAEDFCK